MTTPHHGHLLGIHGGILGIRPTAFRAPPKDFYNSKQGQRELRGLRLCGIWRDNGGKGESWQAQKCIEDRRPSAATLLVPDGHPHGCLPRASAVRLVSPHGAEAALRRVTNSTKDPGEGRVPPSLPRPKPRGLRFWTGVHR